MVVVIERAIKRRKGVQMHVPAESVTMGPCTDSQVLPRDRSIGARASSTGTFRSPRLRGSYDTDEDSLFYLYCCCLRLAAPASRPDPLAIRAHAQTIFSEPRTSDG